MRCFSRSKWRGIRSVFTPCSLCMFSKFCDKRTCLYIDLLIRNESVQYVPWNKMAGMWSSVLLESFFGESQVTMDSLFSSSFAASFEDGGFEKHHSSPCKTISNCSMGIWRIVFFCFLGAVLVVFYFSTKTYFMPTAVIEIFKISPDARSSPRLVLDDFT